MRKRAAKNERSPRKKAEESATMTAKTNWSVIFWGYAGAQKERESGLGMSARKTTMTTTMKTRKKSHNLKQTVWVSFQQVEKRKNHSLYRQCQLKTMRVRRMLQRQQRSGEYANAHLVRAALTTFSESYAELWKRPKRTRRMWKGSRRQRRETKVNLEVLPCWSVWRDGAKEERKQKERMKTINRKEAMIQKRKVKKRLIQKKRKTKR